MTRFWPALFLLTAAAASLPADAAAARSAITPVEIAAAVNRFGIPVAPQQIVLSSNVAATSATPRLQVESVQRWNSGQLMVRLSCAGADECVPFFAELRLNPQAQTQSPAQADPALMAVNLQRSGSTSPLVHANLPATLYLDGDHVHIRLTVICLQNGKLGQTVRASDKDRKIFYTAQVADNGVLKGRL